MAGAALVVLFSAIPATAAQALPTQAQLHAAHAATTGSTYTPVSPTRLLDTRTGDGAGGVIAPLGAGQSIGIQSAGGDTGVPTTATAVVVTVTAVNPTADSFLTAYADGTSRPATSNLDFIAGQTAANLAIVPITDGDIDVWNKNGSTDVVVDLSGYYAPDTTAGTFTSDGPTRLLDTRNGTGSGTIGPLGPNSTLGLQVTNVAGVPINATAVVLNLTAVNPTEGGFLAVYADGTSRPATSNLNFAAGQTVANLVIVPVINGTVDIWNQQGNTDVVADLFGYYSAGAGSTFVTSGPTRVLDTRNGTGTNGVISPLAAGSTLTLPVSSLAGIPSNTTAVVIHVTAVDETQDGYLTVYPDSTTKPNTSNVCFTTGEISSNLSIIPVINGNIDIWNFSGTTDVVADVSGYYSAG